MTVQAMRESTVDPNVCDRCVNEGMHFLAWCTKKHPDWLMDDFREECTKALEEREGEKAMARRARIKALVLNRVRGSMERKILAMDKMTPEGVMEFLAAQCNQKTGKALSNSGHWKEECNKAPS